MEIASVEGRDGRASKKHVLQLAMRRERRKRQGKGRLKRRQAGGESNASQACPKKGTRESKATNREDCANGRVETDREATRSEKRKRRKQDEGTATIGEPRKPTNFELYLEQQGVDVKGAGKDPEIKLQKELAKKLGKKGSKGPKDGLDDLLEGIVSSGSTPPLHGEIDAGREHGPDAVDSDETTSSNVELEVPDIESTDVPSSSEEDNQDQEGEEHKGTYVPPAARKRAILEAVDERDHSQNLKVSRRIRSLLNKLAESNVMQTVEEVSEMVHEMGRGRIYEITAAELIKPLTDGPLVSSLFATIVACFAGGLAATCRSSEFLAILLSKAATAIKNLHDEPVIEDRTRPLHNVNYLVSKLFLVGAVDSGLVYGLLDEYKANFDDSDISSTLQLLKECGTELRSADPAKMKEFVLSIHERAALARAETGLSKRAELMLETVCAVKNNKLSVTGGKSSAQSTALLKLVKNRGVDGFRIKGIPWSALTVEKKVGLWWLPAAIEGGLPALDSHGMESVRMILKDNHGSDLLKSAAKQRMNTDVRRAVFCVIMGAEDYVDAFEKLLRLPLKGVQEREIIRVLVDCCLHESVYNGYYGVLGNKLCVSSQSHKFTMQYCMWDHLKTLETMDTRRLGNLSHLLLHLISHGGVSLSVLRVVDWQDAFSMPERLILFLRLLMENLLFSMDDAQLQKLFGRLSQQPACVGMCEGLSTFVRIHMQRCLPSHQSKDGADHLLLAKKRLVLSALASHEDSPL
uniref:MI domain-containing protein n=2 Tax=Picocystis salinarum TaxID=88271 RepID=A0A7S3UI00_9CHLO